MGGSTVPFFLVLTDLVLVFLFAAGAYFLIYIGSLVQLLTTAGFIVYTRRLNPRPYINAVVMKTTNVAW